MTSEQDFLQSDPERNSTLLMTSEQDSSRPSVHNNPNPYPFTNPSLVPVSHHGHYNAEQTDDPSYPVASPLSSSLVMCFTQEEHSLLQHVSVSRSMAYGRNRPSDNLLRGNHSGMKICLMYNAYFSNTPCQGKLIRLFSRFCPRIILMHPKENADIEYVIFNE